MNWSSLAFAVLLLAAGCVGPTPATPPGTAQQSPLTLTVAASPLDIQHAGAEPSIAIGPAGEIYVCAPTGIVSFALDPIGANGLYRSSHVWRSDDGGKNWTWLDPNPVPGLPVHTRGAAPGGGDCDIAVAKDGTVYVVDLTAADVSLAISSDRGATWKWTTPAAGLPADDREWVATAGEGNVYVVYHELGTGVWVSHSSDAGLTFPDHWLALRNTDRSSCACPPSQLVVSPDGRTLAVASYGAGAESSVGVAVSHDGGATWAFTQAYGGPGAPAQAPIPALAMDPSGNLAVVWIGGEADHLRVRMATSTDGGKTWSNAVNVTAAPSEEALPWVSAIGVGRFAVTFARSDPDGWNVHLAVTADAFAASPRFVEAQLSTSPAIKGDLARPLADFFENAVTAQGRVVVPWTSDLPGEGMRMWFGSGVASGA
jgi:DNA-binding beta-propeller fold protein YncE